MKLGVQLIICLAGCVALCARGGTTGVGDGNPYRVIFERNVFDLKPPPPPVTTPVPTNDPPPNVKLTGLTTILGNKRALFTVQPAPQPGRPPGKEEQCMLAEGERQDGLEVLEINEKAETVRISNDGTVSTITFDKPKTTGPAPGAAGGNPAGFSGGAGFANPGGQQPAGGYRARGGYNPNAPNGGGPPMPQFPQFNTPGQPGQPGQPTQPMTAEERAALVRLYRSKLNQQQTPEAPVPPAPGQ